MTVGCQDSVILIGHLRSYSHPLHLDLTPDVSTRVLPLGAARPETEREVDFAHRFLTIIQMQRMSS